MEYTPTIGLEIHAELKTATKMFCNSRNTPEHTRPNEHICPVCMAHPGTLPVINKEAVRHVLKVGLAVSGTLADYTEFDRKNYFYPDIPKGYQISQYKYPLVSDGKLAGVQITRVHLEEDTARSTHHTEHSLVDYNRAGVPLMELVTEPVIKTADEAVYFAKELQILLRSLKASNANMEKGEMRVEANISVSADPKVFGTKVEVKNLNSFKALERAIYHEIARQSEVLRSGGTVIQETRGWDENRETTFSQRKKESAHDYRYFPDPDLPKLRVGTVPDFAPHELRAQMGELPWDRRARYITTLGISEEAAEIFVRDAVLGDLFDAVIPYCKGDTVHAQRAANYISSDLTALIRSDEGAGLSRIDPEQFARLMTRIGEGVLSSRGAKNVLVIMYREGGDPMIIAEREGLIQKNDTDALQAAVRDSIVAHPQVVADYKSGKEAALQFLVGQGMKATRGSANPELLKKIFLQELA